MTDQNLHHDDAHSTLPAEVEAWLNEQPAEDAKAIQEVWNLAAHAQQFDTPHETDAHLFEQMRIGVQDVIKGSAITLRVMHTPAPMRLLTRWSLRLAAGLIILAMAGSFWWTRPLVHVAPRGGKLSVQLSDGSEISLNSGSRLLYQRSFGSRNRNVTLQGEAFFDVVHDDMPFKVETFNGSVTVLGTRFNVRAWESDDVPETAVVLEQGSVLLAGLAQDKVPVVLKPGEISRIYGKNAPSPPAPVDITPSIAWRVGGLMFVDQQVGVVADEIQRRFNVQVKVIPQSLRQERVTLKLSDARNAEEVLATLAIARGYRLEESNGMFKLLMP